MADISQRIEFATLTPGTNGTGPTIHYNSETLARALFEMMKRKVQTFRLGATKRPDGTSVLWVQQDNPVTLLIEAAKLFRRGAQEARDAMNAAGIPCPASIALAAEKAAEALKGLMDHRRSSDEFDGMTGREL